MFANVQCEIDTGSTSICQRINRDCIGIIRTAARLRRGCSVVGTLCRNSVINIREHISKLVKRRKDLNIGLVRIVGFDRNGGRSSCN